MAEQGEVFVDLRVLLGAPKLRGFLKRAVVLADTESGHYTFGSYIQALTNSELSDLVEAGFATTTSPDAQSELALLAAIILNAEGSALGLAEDTTVYVRRLVLLAQAEQLSRAGWVSLDYPTISISTFSSVQVQLTDAGKHRWRGVSVDKKGPL